MSERTKVINMVRAKDSPTDIARMTKITGKDDQRRDEGVAACWLCDKYHHGSSPQNDKVVLRMILR
jgi:hypothetical protein